VLCSVTRETLDASATGVVKVIVKVPEPLVTDEPVEPDPSWKVPALFQTLATVFEVAKIGSAVEVVESKTERLKSTPLHEAGIPETVTELR
jgi:hypothetical protein